MLAPREKIALALTLPSLLAVTAGVVLYFSTMMELSDLALLAAMVWALFSSLSIFLSVVSLVYLLASIRVIRLSVQLSCWIVNIAWLLFCFAFLLPHSLPR
jgi:hypothetical protein